MKSLLFFFGAIFFLKSGIAHSTQQEKAFFQACQQYPYHISVGAVLVDHNGHIACHHFTEILGQQDIYILMRESMENDETLLMTLHRGLQEEFGATATPIAYLGCLSGFLPSEELSFEKTTLYILCEVIEWDETKRDPDDPEAMSTIEWLQPEELISIMQRQGERFNRVDADESEIIKRALPYIDKR